MQIHTQRNPHSGRGVTPSDGGRRREKIKDGADQIEMKGSAFPEVMHIARRLRSRLD